MIVEEIVKDNGQEELSVTTVDNKGKVISNQVIDSVHKGTEY